MRKAIGKAKGNATAAARLLGVDDNTIWRWIDRLALENYLIACRSAPDGNRRGVHAGGKHGAVSTRVDT